MAESMCGRGGIVEWSKGSAGDEPESGRGKPQVERDEGENGVEGRSGWSGADGVLYSKWNAVCGVRKQIDRAMMNMAGTSQSATT